MNGLNCVVKSMPLWLLFHALPLQLKMIIVAYNMNMKIANLHANAGVNWVWEAWVVRTYHIENWRSDKVIHLIQHSWARYNDSCTSNERKIFNNFETMHRYRWWIKARALLRHFGRMPQQQKSNHKRQRFRFGMCECVSVSVQCAWLWKLDLSLQIEFWHQLNVCEKLASNTAIQTA